MSYLKVRRDQREDQEQVSYFYDNFENTMKTGDLVLYSGRGPVHDLLKLRLNVPFTHVGMVREDSTEQRNDGLRY